MSATLSSLVVTYLQARAAWEAVDIIDDRKSASCPEWGVYEKAGHAVIEYRCQTFEELSVKASIILNDESMVDTLTNCTVNSEPGINLFLRSLIVMGDKSCPIQC